MAEYQFLVTVDTDVEIPDGDEHERTPAEFAKAVLWSASLRDAQYLDGYGDLAGGAAIVSVQEA